MANKKQTKKSNKRIFKISIVITSIIGTLLLIFLTFKYTPLMHLFKKLFKGWNYTSEKIIEDVDKKDTKALERLLIDNE